MTPFPVLYTYNTCQTRLSARFSWDRLSKMFWCQLELPFSCHKSLILDVFSNSIQQFGDPLHHTVVHSWVLHYQHYLHFVACFSILELLICPMGVLIKGATKTKWPLHWMYYALHAHISTKTYISGFIKVYLSFLSNGKGNCTPNIRKRHR